MLVVVMVVVGLLVELCVRQGSNGLMWCRASVMQGAEGRATQRDTGL